jgi:hypothetical protein
MLLGSIGFQMLLFYLVNHPDEDMKLYSWQVLSKTVSIFCAVLLFQACNGLVEEYVIEGMRHSAVGRQRCWPVVIDIVHMLFWLVALQIVLALTSGAVQLKAEPEEAEPKSVEEDKKEMEEIERNMKSFSVLFAHIAGFASINAWGSVQQTYLKSSPFAAICAVPIGLVGLFGVFFLLDVVREKIANSDDGVVDKYEAKWDEETEDAENDVAGLSLSFLTVQVIRFVISGDLPDQEGADIPPTQVFGRGQWISLLLIGLIFEVIAIFVSRRQSGIPESAERLRRGYSIANNYFSFGNSWCFFYAVRWAIVSSRFTDEAALMPVCIALFLSAVSFLFIRILDKIIDQEILGKEPEEAIELVIQGLGVLVGFSWEQCFDVAVGVVASANEHMLPPSLSKLVMSVLLVLIVFPAWRLYILESEQKLLSERGAKRGEVSEEVVKEKKMRHFISHHSEIFMNEESEEHLLDMAHLKLKMKRRRVHGRSHLVNPNGLKHCTVTGAGIQEVDPGELLNTHGASEGSRRNSHLELNEPLLTLTDCAHTSTAARSIVSNLTISRKSQA